MRKFAIAVVASGVVTFGAADARASLVGAYEGKWSCSGVVGGQPGRDKQDVTAQVTDLGEGRAAVRLSLSSPIDFEVFVRPVTAIPVSGISTLAGISCGLDQDLTGATLMATSREKNGKAQIRGILIRMGELNGETYTCKLALKRVSTTDPALEGCVTSLATDS